MRALDFLVELNFHPRYGPGVNSASNRNGHEESSWGCKKRSASKSADLTAICEPIVYEK
jgi:hypothetical protein